MLIDGKKFYATFYEGFKFQISKMNSRTSLFQEEGSDVRHNLLFNYCNLLF